VPLIVGVRSFVAEPFCGAVITGASGAVVSTVNVDVPGWLVFPAASVATAESVCLASVNAAEGEQVQSSPALATVEQILAEPSVTTIAAPGSAVPETSGFELRVNDPFAGDAITGRTGAVASTRNVLGALFEDALPAASLPVAVIVCGPSTSDALVHDHPEGVTGAFAQSSLESSDTVTLTASEEAVPLIVGVRVRRRALLSGAVIDGAGGGVLSTVNVTPVPVPFVPVGVIVCDPSVNVVDGVQDQPDAPTVTFEHSCPWVESRTVTLSPAVPLPDMTGLVLFVRAPDAGEVICGTTNGSLIVKVRGGLVAVAVPLLAVAVTE
jgi:hypothetical protein